MFLSHYSALEYWRTIQAYDRRTTHLVDALATEPLASQITYACVPSIENETIRDRDIMGCLPQDPTFPKPPYDLLVGTKSQRRRSGFKHPHIWPHLLTGESFFKVTPEVYVSSPDFCFLQLAGTLDPNDLALLAYELCGYYTVVDQGLVTCTQLTTVERLRTFAQRNHGVPGSASALAALGHAVDGAGSPREAATALLLCLPVSQGGYGLPLPCMNYRITPSQAQLTSIDGSFFVCDLFWPQARLAVEYNSTTHHANSQAVAKDTRRRNALEHLGIHVVSITTQQINDPEQFDHAAHQIARRLGVRLRRDRLGAAWQHKRSQLRKRALHTGEALTPAP